jgi:hypothetical protein
MNDEALRQFTHDRRHAREREAKVERLAAHARSLRPSRASERASAAVLGHLLAARRHATT